MSMPTAKPSRSAAAKASARQQADERKAKKLHAIASRRASALKLTKEEFIAEIVKGKYRPITAEDIAAEPNPE